MICHLFWCEVVISHDIAFEFTFLGSYIFIAVAAVHLTNQDAITTNRRAGIVAWDLSNCCFVLEPSRVFAVDVLFETER